MKAIPLTQGKTAFVNGEDFDDISRFKWQAMECHRTWYAIRTVNNSTGKFHVMMHRQIALRTGIITEDLKVDHKDGDGLNNLRSNLRAATIEQNNFNARKQNNRSSRFKGVSWKSKNGNWVVQIGFRGKNTHIGSFSDEAEAAKAYDKVAKSLFGEFAWLNFPA